MRLRVRDHICPRCSAKGSHAMGCPEPAIKRAVAAVQAVINTPAKVLDDALDRMPVDRLEQLAERARASIVRRMNQTVADQIDD